MVGMSSSRKWPQFVITLGDAVRWRGVIVTSEKERRDRAI